MVTKVANRAGYFHFAERLREQGFRESSSSDHPICRWTIDNLLVDVMPTDETILGFSNRWYTDAIMNARDYPLSEDLIIRLISSPYFLATKIEAFRGRGNDDLYLSQDMSAVDLMCLKVLAGDTGQSIYGFISPCRRSGGLLICT
jgi:predicted nucleotidyltransferase